MSAISGALGRLEGAHPRPLVLQSVFRYDENH